MKITPNKLFIVLALSFSYACNTNEPKKELVETAEETNKSIRKNEISGPAEDKHKVASAFMEDAASSSLMEIALGKLAQQKSQNSEVRILGQQLEKDHENAYQNLQSLANVKNIVVPATPDDAHQKHINELAEMSSTDFDKQYVKEMVENHEKSIRIFTDAAKNNNMDAEVKAFSEKMLPTLRQHQQMAQKTLSLLK